MNSLFDQCKKYYIESRCISSVLHEISFLPDLEAGIRAAWRKDRVAGPSREHLLFMCSDLQPYLRDQQSFLILLDEIPEFSGQFLKALLGCPGLKMRVPLQTAPCQKCNSIVFDKKRVEGKDVFEGAFFTVPGSVDIFAGFRKFFCSKDCYNRCAVGDYKYPEEPLKKA